ncbi:histidine triad nucleotide-binding protein [Paenibacillus albicereus]|uniref:Histidine triad nucleotide-binding protein n=1 Tax=Paenibacillus albicereus TaxID=2726185 RepID=A0A6H2GYR9_9BACL|nr:histidine triad nucleotide-binding protein [Paenibacillus albicereus]QJC52560.1 histidine triad nucleotide-binding protein [Paenibacillus albicereus]
MSDCIFCKIVEGAIPSSKVFENENVLAFRDIAPAAPVHILIIPKRHLSTMNDAGPEDAALLGELLLTAQKLAAQEGIAESGYRLINNCNSDGGQTAYHLHVHLLGGRPLGALVEGHTS